MELNSSSDSALLASDQKARHRFVHELDQNFSVIAPAGVGKTTAISQRIEEIANHPNAEEWLSSLVVVTYTHKAAQEMHARVRAKLEGKPAHIRSAFQKAFFGTIHSFCVRLLREFGHYLGLPATLDLEENQQDLWFSFIGKGNVLQQSLSDPLLLTYLKPEQLLELAKEPGLYSSSFDLTDPHNLNFQQIFATPEKGQAGKSIRKAKELTTRWLADRQLGFCGYPDLESKSQFMEDWNEFWYPLRAWLGLQSHTFAQQVHKAFRQHRVTQGKLTYQDQVSCALDLLRHPSCAKKIRQRGYRVILDEAQDTDPDQFQLLLEVTRLPEVKTLWFDDPKASPPKAGHFCMVGDPQQSIYSNRADLSFYNQVREKLGKDKELHFQVTYRCAQKIISFVNECGKRLLNGQDGQVSYVTLKERPQAPEGQVSVWTPSPWIGEKKLSVFKATQLEGVELGTWMQSIGYQGLGARSWSQVAVIAPRRKGLAWLAQAFRSVGLSVQEQSTRETWRDQTSYAWFTALCMIMADPHDEFEVAGVLKEIFALPDSAIYRWKVAESKPLFVQEQSDEAHPIAQALNQLHIIRLSIQRLSLRDAVQEMIQRTHLLERLQALEEFTAEKELAHLLMQTAQAEREGFTLEKWAKHLQQQAQEEINSADEVENAVQLITCQKAKGLEWDVVILPLLYAKIHSQSPDYPRIVGNKKVRSQLIFSKDNLSTTEKDYLDLLYYQELQRFLYVSLTRARERLILVNDSALLGDKKDSFASMLDDHWYSNLPLESPPESPCTPSHAPTPITLNSTSYDPALAKDEAKKFLTRKLPHQLSRPPMREEPLDREEQGIDARDYGTWWHRMCECMDWEKPTSWNSTFEAWLTECSYPERAKHEWQLFLNSKLATHLKTTHWRHRSEIPFLIQQNDVAIEGVLDLALFHLNNNTCWLLDWKTNRASENDATKLAQAYAPQLQAYKHALEQLGFEVIEFGIYLTSLGNFISCQTLKVDVLG